MGRALSVLAIAVVALVAAPATAEAADGIALSSDNVFRIDPERPAVVIESTYRMTNVKPDRQLGGGRYEYFYFTGLTVPIAPTATEISVEINGPDGEYTVSDLDGTRYLDIDLGYRLRYQKTATVVVRSVLLGDPPRSEASWVRVNPAYAAFDVWGWGDSGEIGVRIEVPAGWSPEYVGNDLTYHDDDGVQVFEATGIDDPLEWAVLFTGRNDEVLDTSRVSVGGADFEIRSWPGDTAWVEFASQQIVDGVPVLEELLDTSWPVAVETDVIEASTPYLSGYAGFYDSAGDVIEIGEDLDRVVFMHELSHAWVNGEGFVDRWIIEGLAEEIASRAVAALGDEPPTPHTDAELRQDGVEFEPVPLNTWTRQNAGDDGIEDYGYAAAFRAVRALRDEIGEEAMTELLRTALAGERAYPDEDGDTEPAGAIDWREFLDLAEQLGGATDFQTVYRDLVLTAPQLDQLARRNEVLAAHQELVDRSGSWYPPEGLRSHLAAWQFDRAEDAIDDAELTLDVRDELLDVLAPLGLSSPAGVEADYQDERDELAGVRDELTDLVGDAGRLVAARAELAEVLESIDQDVPELSQAEYESSPDGAVETTDELVGDAAALVATDRELADVLVDHGLTVPPLDQNAFVVDRRAAQELLDERLDAAIAAEAVHDARDGATSFVERVGLWRTDVDSDIDRLVDLLADGDTERVDDLAEALDGDIDDLDAVGTRRIALAVAIAAILLAILVVAIFVRRRRRDSTAPTLTPPVGPDAEGSTALSPPPLDDAADSGNGPPDLASGQADAGEAGPLDSHR